MQIKKTTNNPCKNCGSYGGNIGCDVCGPPLRERNSEVQLAQCSVCGRITNDFVVYGSIFQRDECPSQCPHVCSSSCMADAREKIKRGEWILPVLRQVGDSSCYDISKPRKGYDAQPPQAELVNCLISLQNANMEAPNA